MAATVIKISILPMGISSFRVSFRIFRGPTSLDSQSLSDIRRVLLLGAELAGVWENGILALS